MGGHYHQRVGLSAALFLILSLSPLAESAIIYVKPGGGGTQSGQDWPNAKATVSAALTAANSGDEIWVVAGTYAERITIKSGVALYGGFAGTETALAQRNWNANVTTLDGTNSGTVVTISGGAGPTTRIDGFKITGGNAVNGGGIAISGSSPTIVNNLISLNMSTGNGAGIYCYDSSPTIMGNSINFNSAGVDGGGISCWRNSSPYIANNYIEANVATSTDAGDPDGYYIGALGGGGIFVTASDWNRMPHPTAVASPTIVNNIIVANGAYKGAGVLLNDLNGGTAVVVNNSMVANSGPAIHWRKQFSNTSVKLSNNIVAFNAWGLQREGETAEMIRFNDVYENSLVGDRTDYVGFADQTGSNGNISADPQMANVWYGDFHLQPTSPCVDAGSATDVDQGWADFEGQSRIIGNGVDIGADESDGTVWNSAAPIVYVRPDGSDSSNGLSWATAKKTLTGALFSASAKGWEIWVAKGTYSEHINLAPFVYLYGGFNGTESSRDQRNVNDNETIIDGSGSKTIVTSRNTGHLVSGLDGFTIQNGGVYTNGSRTEPSGIGGFGGGIYINVSSPYLGNNLIRWNSLAYDDTPSYGSGIYSRLSYAQIIGNTIMENEILNTFDGKGGGIFCEQSGLTILQNVFFRNHAKYGSAIFCHKLSFPFISRNYIGDNSLYQSYPYLGSNDGAVTMYEAGGFFIEGNIIRDNSAQFGGGIALYTGAVGSIINNLVLGNGRTDGTGGGIFVNVSQSEKDDLIIANNTIVKNTAAPAPYPFDSGGGMAVSYAPVFPTPPTPYEGKIIIANNIMAFNSSGIFQPPSTSPALIPPILRNNNFFNTGPEYFTTDPLAWPNNYKELSLDSTNLLVDPAFVNKDADNFHLTVSSPCIDAGSNSDVPPYVKTDIDGEPRFMDKDLNGPYIVDIGAYEFPGHSDSAAPTGSILIKGGDAYTNSQTIMITLTATDQGTPIEMCLSNTTGLSCPGNWEDFISSRAWFLLPGDGTKTVYVWFKDRFGNVNATPYSDSITLDTIVPTGSIVILNSSAANTNTTGVYLTLTANDANPVQMCVSDTPSCSSWEASSTHKDWTLPIGDGIKTVYVQYRDSAGNSSPQYSDTIMLDQTLPSNGTATATPGDRKITLAWSGFSDGLSGISNYKIMYDSSTTPTHCNTGTMIYLSAGTSFVHTPLANGTTCYYRVCAVDNAGNLSVGVPVSATPHGDVILVVSGVPSGDFDSIQAACNALHEDGYVIKARAVNLTGDVIFSQPYLVELKGGYDPAYTSSSSLTTIVGKLTISSGTVTVEGIALR